MADRIVEARRSRDTGTVVELIDNRDGSFEAFGDDPEVDTRDMRWVTLCTEHGNYVLHRTRPLARHQMAGVGDWCPDCQAEHA